MPQIDRITFFSQLFWLTFCFFSFYILTVSYIIPRISSILKVRAKKVLLDSNDSSHLSKEPLLISNQYDSFFLNVSSHSRQFVQQSNESTRLQVNQDIHFIFRNQLNSNIQSCLDSSALLFAKKSILFQVMRG